MGVLDTGDVITLLAAVAALAVCVWAGAESVRRVRGHRFGHPSVLLGTDEREEEHALRLGFLERRYALVETAGARVLGGVRSAPPGAAGADARDPVEAVRELDRALALLDAEEERAAARVRADFADRRERADRLRFAARRWDLACAGAAVLVGGGAVGAAVAALL